MCDARVRDHCQVRDLERPPRWYDSSLSRYSRTEIPVERTPGATRDTQEILDHFLAHVQLLLHHPHPFPERHSHTLRLIAGIHNTHDLCDGPRHGTTRTVEQWAQYRIWRMPWPVKCQCHCPAALQPAPAVAKTVRQVSTRRLLATRVLFGLNSGGLRPARVAIITPESLSSIPSTGLRLSSESAARVCQTQCHSCSHLRRLSRWSESPSPSSTKSSLRHVCVSV